LVLQISLGSPPWLHFFKKIHDISVDDGRIHPNFVELNNKGEWNGMEVHVSMEVIPRVIEFPMEGK
jgi:hypothetical protein